VDDVLAWLASDMDARQRQHEALHARPAQSHEQPIYVLWSAHDRMSDTVYHALVDARADGAILGTACIRGTPTDVLLSPILCRETAPNRRSVAQHGEHETGRGDPASSATVEADSKRRMSIAFLVDDTTAYDVDDADTNRDGKSDAPIERDDTDGSRARHVGQCHRIVMAFAGLVQCPRAASLTDQCHALRRLAIDARAAGLPMHTIALAPSQLERTMERGHARFVLAMLQRCLSRFSRDTSHLFVCARLYQGPFGTVDTEHAPASSPSSGDGNASVHETRTIKLLGIALTVCETLGLVLNHDTAHPEEAPLHVLALSGRFCEACSALCGIAQTSVPASEPLALRAAVMAGIDVRRRLDAFRPL